MPFHWTSTARSAKFARLGATQPLRGEPCQAPDWIAENEVPIETALRLMSIHTSEMMDPDADLGSLEVGKIADLLILADSPLYQTA